MQTGLSRFRLRFEFDHGEWVVFDAESMARSLGTDERFRSDSAASAQEACRHLNVAAGPGAGRRTSMPAGAATWQDGTGGRSWAFGRSPTRTRSRT